AGAGRDGAQLLRRGEGREDRRAGAPGHAGHVERIDPRQPVTMVRRALLSIALLLGACGQQEAAAPLDDIPIGLLLSYSGGLAANSTNSERAMRLAIERGNAA